jgi:hypothetical protein
MRRSFSRAASSRPLFRHAAQQNHRHRAHPMPTTPLTIFDPDQRVVEVGTRDDLTPRRPAPCAMHLPG